ncbi:MAG: CDP-glycerol glycerophosphotransferase family protein, partial [Blautia sp.]|nr:CDP-glycerol glycerophosphotransferase family protein [Blautia sp.]
MGFKSLFKNTWYVYCGKKEIDPHLILIDTVNRGDLGGNLYRILLELLKPAYQDYKICIACEERVRERALRYLKGERNLRSLTGEEDFSEERVFFVTPGSFRYFTMTAAAGVIFMDVSGTRRFLRRPGQILVNTWHGTPLKRMGKDIPSGKHLIGNIQRNLFMCDYLCLPNLYTEEIFRDAYELRGLFQGTYVRAGYPRNQVFFDKKRQEIVRDLLQKAEGGEKEGNRTRLQKAEGGEKEESRTELHRHGGEEAGRNGRIYVYMPTWRGSGNGKQMSLEDKKAQADRLLGYLREMDALLEKDEVLYIRLHPFVGQMISCDAFLHIREFPAELEPYEVLAAADCLVTDYSSVFYDYANKEDGKIVLFLYGREEYSGERDIYGKIGDLPFPAAENVPELICRMREPKSCDDRSFRGTYCAFDGPSSAEKIVKLSLMRSGTGNRKLSRDEIRQAAKDGGFDVGWEDTGGEKILFYLGGLKKNGMTASFLNLMDTLLKSQAEIGRK